MESSTNTSAKANRGDHYPPAPPMTIQAFCETAECAAQVQEAASDRRLAKATVALVKGGVTAGIEAFKSSQIPNVVIVEIYGPAESVVAKIQALTSLCKPDTKLILVGERREVAVYDDFARYRIADYLVAPLNAADLVRSVCKLSVAPGLVSQGRIAAVMGARGGTGASTIAHNLGWIVSTDLASRAVVVDLGFPFGTARINFKTDPAVSVADILSLGRRITAPFLEQFVSKVNQRLGMLAAPVSLDRKYDIGASELDAMYSALRTISPWTILDLPLQWTSWVHQIFIEADEILIVATPDLASLRNLQKIFSFLKGSRPRDRQPHYLLNQVNPRRQQLRVADFVNTLEQEPLGVLPFDMQLFDALSIRGEMIAELLPQQHPIAVSIRSAASSLTGLHDELSDHKKSSILRRLLMK